MSASLLRAAGFVAEALPTWLNSPGVILLAAGLGALVGLWLDILLPPTRSGIERNRLGTAFGGVFGVGIYAGLQFG